MKKNFLFFGKMAFFTLSLCASFASCSSDDNDAEVTDGSHAPAEVIAVDLGLPSGTKWANVNLGASTPESFGDYFAWGEIVGYSYDPLVEHDFSWDNYEWGNPETSSLKKYNFDSNYGVKDEFTTLILEDDAANVIWGGNWRIPTADELNELRTQCTWNWTKHGSINGYEVTGTNGKSIFIPAAGERSGKENRFQNTGGRIWSSSLASDDPKHAQFFLYYGGERMINTGDRKNGFPIRPVTK